MTVFFCNGIRAARLLGRRAQFVFLLLSLMLSACASTPDSETSTSTLNTTNTSSAVEGSKTPATDTQNIKPEAHKTLRLVAVGDVMLGTDFPEDYLPPNDGQHLLTGVQSILADADITFGNYEGSLLQGGEPAKQCRNPKRCYLFRTPPHYVQSLVQAGFDVMSLANNHARDFGEHGRSSSMSVLANAGILHSGLQGDVALWQVKDSRLALIAFAPFKGAHNPLNIEAAKKYVANIALQNDIVIISMHMGAEGEEALRVPFNEETYHGENRGDVVRFSRAMVEAGADLVIGHGPHVPRALELYEGRLIAYSLGNFCTYFGINVNGLNGLAPILRVTLLDNGEFVQGDIVSTQQLRPNGPRLDPTHQAAKLMAKLTTLDFPQTPLEISADGQIKIKSEQAAESVNTSLTATP